MKVVALVSGGKDSTLNMIRCVQYGHEIVCLAHLRPAVGVEEVDSYCFQSVGQQAVAKYAECMGVPLYHEELPAEASIHTDLRYKVTEGDEVEILYTLLRKVKEQHPDVTAVSSGAILSDYQRLRLENVCARLQLMSLSFLWQYPAEDVLRTVVAAGVKAHLVKVSSMGLTPKKFLGRLIDDQLVEELLLVPHMHAAGEGGEFETFTVDCPLFTKASLELVPTETVSLSSDPFSPCAYLKFTVNVVPRATPPTIPAVSSCPPPTSFHPRAPVQTPDEEVEEEVHQFALHSSDPAQALAELLSRLEALGGYEISDVFFTNVVAQSMATFPEVNKSFLETFGFNNPAAVRAFVACEHNPHAVSVFVCVSRAKRDIVHVQSISDWCAACIGPYAQSCRLRSGVTILAGTLGLIPHSMTLEADLTSQYQRVVKNIQRVLEVQSPPMQLGDIYKAIVYVSSRDDADAVRKMMLSEPPFSGIPSSDETDDGSVVFVVVTTLPRNCLVEIQPYARAAHHRTACLKHTTTRKLVSKDSALGDDENVAVVVDLMNMKGDSLKEYNVSLSL